MTIYKTNQVFFLNVDFISNQIIRSTLKILLLKMIVLLWIISINLRIFGIHKVHILKMPQDFILM